MTEPALSVLASRLISPKTLYTFFKRLASSNDDAVQQEFREQLDEITLELVRRFPGGWENVEDDERPNQDDVRKAAGMFCEAHDDASGPAKRKLLVNAFFGYFNPKFFRDGMNKILWDYAVQLEYPDARYLRILMTGVREQIGDGYPGSTHYDSETQREWRGDQQPLDVSDLDFEFAQRLARVGLVVVGHYGSRSDYVVVTPRRGLVEKLLEFLWEAPAGIDEAEQGG